MDAHHEIPVIAGHKTPATGDKNPVTRGDKTPATGDKNPVIAGDKNPVIAGLRDLYNASPTAREILDSFADWENRKVTSVKRVHRRLARRGSSVDRPEIAQFFETLHAIGLGEFVYGEHERRPRFVWGYALQELPRVASGEAWELAPLPPEAAENGHSNGDDDAHENGAGQEGAAGHEKAAGHDHDDVLGEGDAGEWRAPRGPMIKHVYRLRGDYVVKLRLPIDLTQTEANRLADFIKTLPFGR